MIKMMIAVNSKDEGKRLLDFLDKSRILKWSVWSTMVRGRTTEFFS